MFQFSEDEARLAEVVGRQSLYRQGAYEFVRESVVYASRVVFATGTHVSGGQLLEAIRRLARERYGVMAREVFAYWGIRSTSDIGEIVFQLVEAEILSKTEEDSRDDFRDVFDLDEAFAADSYWKERFVNRKAAPGGQAS